MAKLTKEAFIESLNEMSILEIKELVDAMKEAYGVDPSAVAVAAAPAALMLLNCRPSSPWAGSRTSPFPARWAMCLGAISYSTRNTAPLWIYSKVVICTTEECIAASRTVV